MRDKTSPILSLRDAAKCLLAVTQYKEKIGTIMALVEKFLTYYNFAHLASSM